MDYFTQAQFNEFPVDSDGIRRCPPGDYSMILQFGDRVHFSAGSVFASHSRFGKGCRFGWRSEFGHSCSFDDSCCFEPGIRIGEEAHFGKHCRLFNNICIGDYACFDENCRIGNSCMIGDHAQIKKGAIFGSACSFGRHSRFESDCYVEKDYLLCGPIPMLSLSVNGTNSCSIFAFCTDRGIIFRAGDFFGNTEDFKMHTNSGCDAQYKRFFEAFLTLSETIFW